MTKTDSKRTRTREQGFTLVELLIVVIILAILAAVVVPQFATSTDDARLAALDSTLGNMRSVLDLYQAQHGEYPSALPAAGGDGLINTPLAFRNQLAMYTDADGDTLNTKDATHIYGPYLKKNEIPLEPMTDLAVVEIITAGVLGMLTPGDPGGWKFDNVTGQFIVNHASWSAR